MLWEPSRATAYTVSVGCPSFFLSPALRSIVCSCDLQIYYIITPRLNFGAEFRSPLCTDHVETKFLHLLFAHNVLLFKQTTAHTQNFTNAGPAELLAVSQLCQGPFATGDNWSIKDDISHVFHCTFHLVHPFTTSVFAK